MTSTQQHHEEARRIKVGIRLRPLIAQEVNDPTEVVVANEESCTISLHDASKDAYKNFQFDHILSQHTTQDQVYDIIAKPMVHDFLHGINGAILAYGNTGTGKTYKKFNIFNTNVDIQLVLHMLQRKHKKVLHHDVWMNYLILLHKTRAMQHGKSK